MAAIKTVRRDYISLILRKSDHINHKERGLARSMEGLNVTDLKNDKPPRGETPVPLERAATEVGKSAAWLRAQIRAGRVKAIQLGGGTRLAPEEIRRIQREGLPPMPRPTPKDAA
jgi:hypothetical protein